MAHLPEGTVTFLFTDLEGSTKLLARDPRGYSAALLRHDDLLRSAIDGHGGVVFETVGDAFYGAFPDPHQALAAALAAQFAMRAEPWQIGPLRARMAVHGGEVERRGMHYFGTPLYRCARLMALGHGGQTLVSQWIANAVFGSLASGASLRALGRHRLKDLPELEAVFDLVHPGLPSDFPPLRSLDPKRDVLPIEPTDFIGREQERAIIRNQLGRVRLLTITGPGGAGKTRLALRVARDAMSSFEDGVVFVPLGAIDDPRLVATAIASAVGIPQQLGVAPVESIATALAQSDLLLVLDNFEQVLAAASMVAILLERCPRLKVVATSRVSLHLAGEQVHPVPPLELPSPTVDPRDAESVHLFLERAMAVRPDLRMDPEDLAAIGEICRQVDGLPLAIELAAARTRTFTPKALLTRLNDRLAILTGGPVDAPSRQRSLRATIGWSYELLGVVDRALFGRLGVFSGRFTLEAAEAIAPELDRAGTLDGLATLVDHSLLRSEIAPDGMPRFSMLQLIRDLAGEVLNGADADGTRDRHAAYFIRFAEATLPLLAGRRAGEALNDLAMSLADVRVALDRSLSGQDLSQGARAVAAMMGYWTLHGPIDEAARWLDRALMLPRLSEPDRARLLTKRALAASVMTELDRATELCESALALQRARDDGEGMAECYSILGDVAYQQTRYPEAEALYRQSHALYTRAGRDDKATAELAALGYTLRDAGQLDRAEALLSEAVERARGSEDLSILGHTLLMTGELEIVRGHLPRARLLIAESLDLARAAAAIWGMTIALLNLATISMLESRTDEAAAYCAEALENARQVPSRRLLGACCAVAGSIAALRARPVLAAQLLGALGSTRDLAFGPFRVALERVEDFVAHEIDPQTLNALQDQGARLNREETFLAATTAIGARVHGAVDAARTP